jgi:5-methylcytosine-specific restriction endonuclease McrA
MPTRILRDYTESGLPDLRQFDSVAELVELRRSLPKVHAGHPLQAYKWKLACRVRSIRMKAAGPLTRQTRKDVLSESSACPVCGSPFSHTGWKARTLDHIEPIATIGTNARVNLRAVCASCNSRKGGR